MRKPFRVLLGFHQCVCVDHVELHLHYAEIDEGFEETNELEATLIRSEQSRIECQIQRRAIGRFGEVDSTEGTQYGGRTMVVGTVCGVEVSRERLSSPTPIGRCAYYRTEMKISHKRVERHLPSTATSIGSSGKFIVERVGNYRSQIVYFRVTIGPLRCIEQQSPDTVVPREVRAQSIDDVGHAQCLPNEHRLSDSRQRVDDVS